MAPRKRAQFQSAGAAQAPGVNAKKRRVSARVATSSSKKRKLASDKPDEAENSQVDQVKGKKPRWGRIVGRLAGLMEMPMDILFEIFGHLKPLDVLRLARTTKQFRHLLMHRSAASIWIAARKNVPDLPDCPPYMSEPQFANLVFDTHCHECLSPNIRSVDYRIGRRICSRCAKECMVEDYPHFMGGFAFKAVPSKYGKRGRASYYSRDLDEFQSKRGSFTDPEEREKFVKQRQELVVQMEKHGALLETWAANQATHRSGQLDDLRRERKEAIIEKLTELGWGPEIEQIPYRDLSHHRLVKQPTRLTPRIWANIQAEMVSYMKQMKTQRLEGERKALVIERKGMAVSILRAYKISHLPATDVMPEPMDFCAIPQVSDILELPTETQVTEDTFAPVVEKMDELVDEWRTRILEALTQKVKDSLYSHKPRIEPLGETSDSTFDNTTCSSSVNSTGKGKAKDVELSASDDSQIIQDLSLATTVFNCKSCNSRFGIPYRFYDAAFSSDTDSASSEDDPFGSWEFGFRPRRLLKCNPLFYPKVLGHHCLTKQHPYSCDNTNGDPTEQYNYPSRNRTRWGCQLLQVDEKARKIAVNVVATCGLDPGTTTVDEMDDLNCQLACLECLDWSDEEWDQADAPVFGWRAAVAHNCRFHPGKTNIRWKLIDNELEDDVVDEDEEKRANQAILSAFVLQGLVPDDMYAGPPEEVVWLCVHCMDLPGEAESRELSRMKEHLSLAHSISEPQEDQDYYKDYEAPQGRKARVPNLRITLTMDRPQHVPAPGERRFFDPFCFGFSEDEFEDDYYGDDFY